MLSFFFFFSLFGTYEVALGNAKIHKQSNPRENWRQHGEMRVPKGKSKSLGATSHAGEYIPIEK